MLKHIGACIFLLRNYQHYLCIHMKNLPNRKKKVKPRSEQCSPLNTVCTIIWVKKQTKHQWDENFLYNQGTKCAEQKTWPNLHSLFHSISLATPPVMQHSPGHSSCRNTAVNKGLTHYNTSYGFSALWAAHLPDM